MKKQIVFIHGGETFAEREDYLNFLKTVPLDDPFHKQEVKKWRNWAAEELGETYEAAYPHMPCAWNAQYEEWKIWFERHLAFLRDGVCLVGHSQGGYFLLKYLSENKMPVAVGGLFLVAAPVEDSEYNGAKSGGGFAFDLNLLPEIEKQAEHVFVYQSTDDPLVAFSHAEKICAALPKATLRTFTDRGHFFNQETFPELITDISSL